MEFNDELKTLVSEVADRVDRWTAQPAWIWEPGSSASVEIANGGLAGPERGDMRASRSVHDYDAGSSRGLRRSAWRCTIRHPPPPACRQMCVTLRAVSVRAAPSTRATFLSMSIE